MRFQRAILVTICSIVTLVSVGLCDEEITDEFSAVRKFGLSITLHENWNNYSFRQIITCEGAGSSSAWNLKSETLPLSVSNAVVLARNNIHEYITHKFGRGVVYAVTINRMHSALSKWYFVVSFYFEKERELSSTAFPSLLKIAVCMDGHSPEAVWQTLDGTERSQNHNINVPESIQRVYSGRFYYHNELWTQDVREENLVEVPSWNIEDEMPLNIESVIKLAKQTIEGIITDVSDLRVNTISLKKVTNTGKGFYEVTFLPERTISEYIRYESDIGAVRVLVGTDGTIYPFHKPGAKELPPSPPTPPSSNDR